MNLTTKTLGIKAGFLHASTLLNVDESRICQDYVDGFCRRGDLCDKSHQLCAIDDQQSTPPILQCIPNELSLHPRAQAAVFEDDGPGEFSALGPRHDNDHVDIRDISILPTTDEILSLRPPYMPSKDPHAPHRIPLGQARLLDIDFRQLRHDSVEEIIDCCYHASQQLSRLERQPSGPDYDDRQKSPRGSHYSLFIDVAFEDIMYHDQRGMMLRMSFACPFNLRGRRMGFSNHLEEGMLVALIGLTNETFLSVTFMEIYQRQSTEAMKRHCGNDLKGR